MPSPLWLLAGGYLIVAAASLLEVDVRAVAGTRPAGISVCIAALVFGRLIRLDGQVRVLGDVAHRLLTLEPHASRSGTLPAELNPDGVDRSHLIQVRLTAQVRIIE